MTDTKKMTVRVDNDEFDRIIEVMKMYNDGNAVKLSKNKFMRFALEIGMRCVEYKEGGYGFDFPSSSIENV
jgi:hypothetical protein